MLMTSSHVKEVVCAESVKQLVVMKEEEEEEDNEVVIIVLLPRRREPYLYIHLLYL